MELPEHVRRSPGLTREALVAAVRASEPRLRPRQIDRSIEAALAAGDIVERDGTLWLAEERPGTAEPELTLPRVVCFDLETIVEQTATEPYLRRHLYQIGAVRLSRDRTWFDAEPLRFNRHIELEPPILELLESPRIRARYDAAERIGAADALRQFVEWAAGATHLVAYNGTGLDFGELRALLTRHGFEFPKVQWVDGLYLTHALWPVPPDEHRLRQVYDRIGLEVGEFFWHDALDDARMLAYLLRAGKQLMDSWDPQLRALVARAGAGSEAWDMMFGLSGAPVPDIALDDAAVRRVLADGLRHRQPVIDPALRLSEDEPVDAAAAVAHRVPRPTPVAPPLILPDDIRGPDGVDAFALAAKAKGGEARPRPSQEQMVVAMRGWIRGRRRALVEAPTGTGKSYAMLAVALDWLAGDPTRKVVISTFTKSLQKQMADDLERLGVHVAGLLDVSDVVKGKSNRLSLRGLSLALADLCDVRPRVPVRGRADYTREPRYRDLVLYLALRLLAEGTKSEEWLAHSVDVIDIPPFFEEYCGRRQRAVWLLNLSQARSGELRPDAASELAAHTSTVREALAAKRLIVANHALLFANLEDFGDAADRTLLLLDEAHVLESAATTALSASVAAGDLDALVVDTRAYLAAAAPGPQAERIGLSLTEFVDQLEAHAFHAGAMRAFDASGAGGGFARRTVIGSPLSGAVYEPAFAGIKTQIANVSRLLSNLRAAIVAADLPADPSDADRLLALKARAATTGRELRRIADALSDIDRWDRQLAGEPEPTPPPGVTPPPPLTEEPNLVVWLEELPGESPVRTARDLRFRMWASPIELGRDPDYHAFVDAFGLSYYISATLRVGRDPEHAFDFARRRLALPADRVEAIALDSPFDAAAQARLVAFDDFPSWTEQTEAAERTVAHQLAGYATELIDGERNGAMVLTTARRTLNGIAEHLFAARLAAGRSFGMYSTELLGGRAVEQFNVAGGFLVGTKGLWQGTDVDEPDRLRLVWINKLPFPSFEDPLIKTRRALIAREAGAAGAEDPDAVANETYYLPLAAIDLRQAVGRLLRTTRHAGVVVISDRKLAGPGRLRRLYRDVFLGSLDPGLLVADPETGEPAGGNVVSMATGWRRIWRFFAEQGLLSDERAAALSTDEALREQTLLPQLRRIRELQLTAAAVEAFEADPAAFGAELGRRCAAVAGELRFRDGPLELHREQQEAIAALAAGRDVLGILPTGFGKSFVFQLPALTLPGVTIVISPTVSLMHDQAIDLNRSIGGAVRALVAPMRESNSRTGKSEVADQLTGRRDYGIKLIYLSPERLCTRQFQDIIRAGVAAGIVRRIAIDEAHTFVTWGDDFRPSFKRAELFLRELRARHPTLQLLALTATATPTVRDGLRAALFGLSADDPDPASLAVVRADPLRTNLALWSRSLSTGSVAAYANLVTAVAAELDRHAVVYCLTVKDAVAVHNLLLTHFGEQERDQIRLYHGRLPDTIRAGVLSDFRNAPAYEDDPGEFRRLIVVATSAFGLGIDRPDVRTVFCASPPTDLSALYQQVGRAGRDGQLARGLMLLTSRSQRLLRFMTRRELDDAKLLRVTGHLLRRDRNIDTRRLGQALATDDLAAGRARPEDLERGLADRYTVAVVRVLAELGSAGLLTDLGDFPERVTITSGSRDPDTTEYRDLVAAVRGAAGRDPVGLVELHDRLGVDGLADELPDPGALWSLLLTLHGEGYLDVSQQGNRAMLTGVRHHATELPNDFIRRFARRQTALEDEVTRLIGFFGDERCLTEQLAGYFGVTARQCAPGEAQCSRCAGEADRAPATEPPLWTALYRPTTAYRSRGDLRAKQLKELVSVVDALLRYRRKGLAINLISAVLRGEDRFYSFTARQRKPLWPALTESIFFGRYVNLTPPELQRALDTLCERGTIERVGGVYRNVQISAFDAARAAAAVARAAGVAAPDQSGGGVAAP